jgi:hypothetical protein
VDGAERLLNEPSMQRITARAAADLEFAVSDSLSRLSERLDCHPAQPHGLISRSDRPTEHACLCRQAPGCPNERATDLLPSTGCEAPLTA